MIVLKNKASKSKVLGKTNNILLLAATSLALVSCSTYSTKFACGEGNGLPCEMLRTVDKKIDSGEIDKLYKEKCKGKHCVNNFDEIVKPKGDVIRAKLASPDSSEDVVIEGSNTSNSKFKEDELYDN